MTNTALIEATEHRDAARAEFNAATPGTKAWRDAEEELNFWQGKVAALDHVVAEAIIANMAIRDGARPKL